VATRTRLVAGAVGALIALGVLGRSTPSFAQPTRQTAGVTSSEGVVVAIEKDDVIVDLAGKRGAASGDVLELWRPLKLKHPVTGKMVTDRFRIGALKLTQVRESLALAQPDGKLAREPEVGDIVVLRKAKLEEPTKPAPGAPAQPPSGALPALHEAGGAELDPETKFVSELFDSLKGSDVTRRIIAYEDYVRKNPQGRYAVVLWEEASHLRKLLAYQQSGGKSGAMTSPKLESFKGPDEALSGIPVEIGVELSGPYGGAVLHARRGGEVAYQSTPMTESGKGYFVVTIPAERVRAPQVQYFIEAISKQGAPVPVVASADEPVSMDVDEIPKPTPPLRNEATASIWTDYANYNQGHSNDWVWQTEGFVGMRFGDVGFRALRTGFGVFRGVGGSLEELDKQQKGGRLVGLTYGYLEAEVAFSSFASLIGRGVIGLRDDGVAGGAQALVRIGNDKKTNLQLGGEVLGGIGLRGITELDLNVFERVPIMFRTEVTNQPAGSSANVDSVAPQSGVSPSQTSLQRGEVGARAIFQLGYRLTPALTLAARGSFQGRTIKHVGPGFGGAVTYTW
jgi:hypothetical protein